MVSFVLFSTCATSAMSVSFQCPVPIHSSGVRKMFIRQKSQPGMYLFTIAGIFQTAMEIIPKSMDFVIKNTHGLPGAARRPQPKQNFTTDYTDGTDKAPECFVYPFLRQRYPRCPRLKSSPKNKILTDSSTDETDNGRKLSMGSGFISGIRVIRG